MNRWCWGAIAVTLAWLTASNSARAERPDQERPERPTSASRIANSDPASTRPALPEQIEDTGGIPPAGYHRVDRIRAGVAITGIAMFSLSYAPALLIGISAAGCEPGKGDEADVCQFPDSLASTLPVPVVGPLMAISPVCGGTSNPECSAVLISDALAQAAGLALLIYGLTTRSVFERYEAKRDAPRYAVSGFPLTGGGMAAVAVAF